MFATAIPKCPAFHRYLLLVLSVTLYMGLAATAAHAAPGEIPILHWPRVMSDWIDVTAAPYNANGNDQLDDTAAIQAALNDMMHDCQRGGPRRAIYLPAGTYYIASTLTTDSYSDGQGGYGGVGTAIYGTGRTTILKWTGAAGGTMFTQGGWPHAWHEGITWDGQNIAAVGIDNRIALGGHFPTGQRHQNEAFLNFTTAGIRTMSSPTNIMFSEMLYRNCLFDHCGAGIFIHLYNTYNHRIEQCEFRNCGDGVHQEYWANAYIQECHFEHNTGYDVNELYNTVNVSIRRCTSKNSHAFASGQRLTIEDCVVDGWTNTDHAVNLVTSDKAEMIFDTRFLNPPAGAQPPIKADDYGHVLLSNVRLNNSPTGLAAKQNLCLIAPPGKIGGVLVDANERFLKDTWPMPGVVKDLVQDFGAVSGKDATTAFQNGVAAVKALGNGAWLYVPAGDFYLSKTIVLDGANYVVSGNCPYNQARILAAAGFTEAAFELRNAQHVGLQRMCIWNGLDVRQTSVAGGTSSTSYDGLFLESGGTLRLESLPLNSTVEIVYLTGKLYVSNSSRAKILGRFVQGDSVLVDGVTAKDGFFGFLTLNGCPQTCPLLEVRDNQDVVASDFYFEQARWGALKIVGNGESAGRVTADFARADAFTNRVPNKIEVEAANYQGRLSLFDGCWDQESDAGGAGAGGLLVQTGTNPIWLTLWGQTSVPLLLKTNNSAAIFSAQHHGLAYSDTTVQLGGLAKVAEGLDDLAQLGKVSLDFGGYAAAAQTLDNKPPAVPNGCAVTTSNSAFHISWHAVGDADLGGYNLYRAEGNGPLLRLNTEAITTTSFDDNTSHAGSAFSYQVTAVDAFGNESAASVAVRVAAPPAFTPAGADPSLLGHWSFEEGSGTALMDSSGHGNHGVIAGATWSTAGKYGNCLYFDGKTAKVTIPDGSWNTAAPKTIIAWYKIDTATQGNVFDHGMTGANPGSFLCYDHNGIDFCGYDAAVADTHVRAPGAAAGVWRMVAVTQTPNLVKVFADGVDAGTSHQTNGWPKIPGNLYFGARGEVPDGFFKGWIDEVTIYNRVLSAAEIQAMYQGTPTNPPVGTYASKQLVTISSATPGATIRYTTDGTLPSQTNGIVYTNPVAITQRTTLQAIVYKLGFADSIVTSGIYTITNTQPTAPAP